MTGFEHEERVSRRQAAERLADLAYALTVGGTLDLRVEGEQLTVRIAEDVVLRWQAKARGDHSLVEVELSWRARLDGDGDAAPT